VTSSNVLVNGFLKPKPAVTPDPSATGVDPRLLPPVNVELAWPLGHPVSMHVRLIAAPNEDMHNWKVDQGRLPSFTWENIIFGNWNEARSAQMEVEIPEVCLNAVVVGMGIEFVG
jgi:hypothetical protein